MASYTIIQHAVQRVEGDLWTLTYTGQDITNGLNDVKALYEVVNIENQVVDGNEPFPENVQDTARNGVKIEFLCADTVLRSSILTRTSAMYRSSTQTPRRMLFAKFRSRLSGGTSRSSSVSTVLRVIDCASRKLT